MMPSHLRSRSVPPQSRAVVPVELASGPTQVCLPKPRIGAPIAYPVTPQVYVPPYTEARRNARGTNGELVRHKGKVADLVAPSVSHTVKVEGKIEHEHHVYHHGDKKHGHHGGSRSHRLPPSSFRGGPGVGSRMTTRRSRSITTTTRYVERGHGGPHRQIEPAITPGRTLAHSKELERFGHAGLDDFNGRNPVHPPRSMASSRGMPIVEDGRAMSAIGSARGVRVTPDPRSMGRSRGAPAMMQDGQFVEVDDRGAPLMQGRRFAEAHPGVPIGRDPRVMPGTAVDSVGSSRRGSSLECRRPMRAASMSEPSTAGLRGWPHGAHNHVLRDDG